MNRYLITGATGFVARHLARRIRAEEPEAAILGVDKDAASRPEIGDFAALDLLDARAVERTLLEARPTRIVHLASLSSVAGSWEDPAASFANNTSIFLNLLEAVRRHGLACRILSVGSSEEYGAVGADEVPVREERALAPTSPYAVARVAQEQLSLVYARSLGLDIVMTRSFNHVGPGQRPVFVLPSIVRQFAEGRGGPVELAAGDVSAVRDFTDVRDVADAYLRLLREGASGEAYNVCSGKGVSIAEAIELVSRIAGRPYVIKVDPARLRPTENPILVGSHEKLSRATGWSPTIPLERSLADILASMRKD